MPAGYLSIMVMLFLSAVVAAVVIIVPPWLGPKRPSPTKLEPYESGVKPFMLPRHRFPVHYYMVAILFILFDIEILFLYPWAVLLRQLGWTGIVEMAIFLGILILGFVYAWRKGALEWIR